MNEAGSRKKKGLLLDCTLCIGCGACCQACKESHGLPRSTENYLQDSLSETNYTVVNYRDGHYVRKLCMHCEVPTCVSVCPVTALEKTPTGPVIYYPDRCMGCRYCMQACPFQVPRYEWKSTRPLVRKCDFCAPRLEAGQSTACAQVCPTGATLFGDRDALIQEARARIASGRRKYIDRIYGLEDVGGTSVLYLSDVPLGSLGYRTDLGTKPLPLLTWQVLEKIPGVVLFSGVILGGIWWITNRRMEIQEARIENKGVRNEDA